MIPSDSAAMSTESLLLKLRASLAMVFFFFLGKASGCALGLKRRVVWLCNGTDQHSPAQSQVCVCVSKITRNATPIFIQAFKASCWLLLNHLLMWYKEIQNHR